LGEGKTVQLSCYFIRAVNMAELRKKYEVRGSNDYKISDCKVVVIINQPDGNCSRKLRHPIVVAIVSVLATSAVLFFLACNVVDRDFVFCNQLEIKWRSFQLMRRLRE
jgi:hypothetical protein